MEMRTFSKYVVINRPKGETIYTFTPDRQHKTVALQLTDGELGLVVGAGFCSPISCYGDSMSLNIWSREEDTKLLHSDFHVDLD